MTTLTRERKPLKPVSATGTWLKRPICPCEMIPAGVPGVLLIDGTPYLAALNAELPEPVVYGGRLTKSDGTSYDVDCSTPWGWQCDCPDATYRGTRPGGCRHVAALRSAGVA